MVVKRITASKQGNVQAYVKYNNFHKELREKQKRNGEDGLLVNLYYDFQKDRCICPMGQLMEGTGVGRRLTSTGFVQHYRSYRAQNYTGCPLAGTCKIAEGTKVLQVNRRLQDLKEEARQALTSESGIEKRKQRATDLETVFGHLKHNIGMKRYVLRGLVSRNRNRHAGDRPQPGQNGRINHL